MTTLGDRGHVSIGDVLEQLRGEFPDVTISKIRFLESQGLIAPERTPSGYRKFSFDDVERLRWVLRQQKEHFLPLKVIRERLDELGPGDALPPDALPRDAEGAPVAPETTTAHLPRPGEAPGPLPVDPADDRERAAPEAVALTRHELAAAVGLSDDDLAELEEYGVVVPAERVGDRVVFDGDGLVAAAAAAAFLGVGLEARHLRMYRTFAEREASLFEQVLLPYRRQRNPEAQARATEAFAEMVGHGRDLRAALLRQSVRSSSRA